MTDIKTFQRTILRAVPFNDENGEPAIKNLRWHISNPGIVTPIDYPDDLSLTIETGPFEGRCDIVAVVDVGADNIRYTAKISLIISKPMHEHIPSFQISVDEAKPCLNNNERMEEIKNILSFAQFETSGMGPMSHREIRDRGEVRDTGGIEIKADTPEDVERKSV